MSKVLVDEQSLQDIADAIRGKIGVQDTYKPGEMSTAINNIPSGGDVSDYFNTNISDNNVALSYLSERRFLKKLPNIHVSSSVTRLYYTFSGCNTNIILDNTSDTSNVTGWESTFGSYKGNLLPDNLDMSSAVNLYNTFAYCSNVTNYPTEITSNNVTSMQQTFNHSNIDFCPNINTANVTTMYNCFSYSNITEFPDYDFSSVTNLSYFMCNTKITEVGDLYFPEATDISGMLMDCSLLESVGNISAPKATNIDTILSGYSMYNLVELGEIDCSSVVQCNNPFGYSFQGKVFTDFAGFKDIGKAYLTTRSANYSYYRINLSITPKLTHDSLMNVINKLYDIASAGVQTQQLVLGSTNLSKLTAEEIAIATNKGWTVS